VKFSSILRYFIFFTKPEDCPSTSSADILWAINETSNPKRNHTYKELVQKICVVHRSTPFYFCSYKHNIAGDGSQDRLTARDAMGRGHVTGGRADVKTTAKSGGPTRLGASLSS
jgi:hypothetical protein